jgi:hypothetical protein
MTLVEVVVSLAITALLIGGITSGYVFCTFSSQKQALALAASARAMERIEETRSAKWDTATSPVVDQLVGTNFSSRTVTLDLTGSGAETAAATIRTEISSISTNPPLRRVSVECVWRYRGELFTNTVETFRAPDQ